MVCRQVFCSFEIKIERDLAVFICCLRGMCRLIDLLYK